MEKELSPINCIEHPKLLVSYYCPNHNKIFCENCKSEIHSECSAIQTIKDASNGITESEAIKSLESRLLESKELLSVTTDKLEDNISTLSRQYDSIKQNIHNARKSINEYFNSLEDNLTSMVHDRCIKRVEEKIVLLEQRKYILEQWEDELQSAIRSDDEEIIFSITTILQELQNELDSYLSSVPKDTKISHVRWKPIRTDKTSVASFVGTLSISESTSALHEPSTARSEDAGTRQTSFITHSHDDGSVGDVSIQPESTTEQGLESVSTKTQQGWKDISSKVNNGKAIRVEDGLTEERGKSAGHRIKIDEDENSKKDGNEIVEGETSSSAEKLKKSSPIEKKSDEQAKETETSRQCNGETDYKDATSEKINDRRSSMSSVKRTDRPFSVKSKFEANLLDKKSSAEVKKGIFLLNDYLLFLDKVNKHIFICDKSGKVKNKINLSHQPEDVTTLDNSRVVVTLGEQGVQTINLDPIKKEKVHDVGGFCNAITSYKGQIIVSVDHKLRLLDMFGYTLRRIQHDGSASFVCSDNKGKIYYTDSMNHTVHCMAWFGIPVFTYSNYDLKCPMGIVVDSDQFIYVAGFESSNVQKLWPNGCLHSEFLSEKDDIYEPSSLAYNEIQNEILVISENSQTIELYDLHDIAHPQQ